MIVNMGTAGMKCDKCGTEVNEKGTCVKCGAETQPAADAFNVTYKTFGTSELLEISPRKKEAAPQETVGEKSSSKPNPGRPLSRKPVGQEKMSFLVAAAVILLVVLITAIFFWFFYTWR